MNCVVPDLMLAVGVLMAAEVKKRCGKVLEKLSKLYSALFIRRSRLVLNSVTFCFKRCWPKVLIM